MARGLIFVVFTLIAVPFWTSRRAVLCGTWLAHPGKYDYLQSVTFRPDGTGELVWGDHQVIRHDEAIRYTTRDLGKGEFQLDFTGHEKRRYQGRVKWEKGRYEFEREGPGGGKVVFRRRLTFSSCPFGFLTSLDYYGEPVK